MHTPSTGAAAPQQAITFPFPLESDAGHAAAGELPLLALGANEARVALESRQDRLSLNAVFAALEQERQRQPDEHPRDLLGALLESHNLRLSNCLVHDAVQAAGLANRQHGTMPVESPTARLARALAEPNPPLEETLRARLARALADREPPQAAGTTTARSRLLEQAAQLALRPGACPSLLAAMEQGLAALPADLQAAWLAEWLSWPQPPAGTQEKAMALIHSGQLSDAARTNLLAKVTVRNLIGPSTTSLAPLHYL